MDSAVLEISYTVVAVFLLSFYLYRSLYLTQKHHINWFLFGFFFNLYGLSWLYTVYPLSWLPSGPLQLAGIVILHLILACGAGLSFALIGYAFTKNRKPWQQAFLFVLLLTCSEVLRSLIFSLIFAGKGSTLGLHWTSGTVGSALSSTPFIEYAYLGGTYMLTAVLGLLVFTALSYKKLKFWYGSYVILVLGCVFIHYAVPIHMPASPLRVGVITTDFPKAIDQRSLKSEFAVRFSKLDEMTHNLTKDNIDILTYPEDARYTNQLDEKHLEEFSKVFPSTLFIDGETRGQNGELSNFSLFYTPENTRNLWGRGKVFLFPFNEYIPYVFRPVFKLFLTKEEFVRYEAEHTYIPRSSIQTFPFKGERVGTLICSEIISFQTIRTLAKQRPSLVIFQSYLSIFNGEKWFSMHDRSFSKIAAAQLRAPLITSTNGAESYVISPHGSVVSVIPQGFSVSIFLVSTTTVELLR